MNYNKIILFVLFVLIIVVINIPIWIFSEASEHELVWKVASIVVSVIAAIGLALWLIIPNLTSTNQSEKSKTVVYILNTDGNIIETYEGVSGVLSNYTSISFDCGGKKYYFKNVPVKVVE